MSDLGYSCASCRQWSGQDSWALGGGRGHQDSPAACVVPLRPKPITHISSTMSWYPGGYASRRGCRMRVWWPMWFCRQLAGLPASESHTLPCSLVQSCPRSKSLFTNIEISKIIIIIIIHKWFLGIGKKKGFINLKWIYFWEFSIDFWNISNI